MNAHLARIFPVLLAAEAAFGQVGTTSHSGIRSNPPNAAALGETVTLSVLPAAAGASYRFVAIMLSTGAGTAPTRGCARGYTIGTGPTVTWTPASGTYRLTAYELSHTSNGDTLVSQYQVRAPDAVVTAAYSPPQPPPGGTSMASLIVSAKDLGPGHRYRFSVRFGGPSLSSGQAPTSVPPPWTFESDRYSLAYPVPVSSTIPAFASASVHRGNPCQIVAAGASPSPHGSR